MRTITYDETKWRLVPITPAYRSRLAGAIPVADFAGMMQRALAPVVTLFVGGTQVFQTPPAKPSVSQDAAEKLAATVYEKMLLAAPDDHRNEEQVGAGEGLEHVCPHEKWVQTITELGPHDPKTGDGEDGTVVYYCPDPADQKKIQDTLELWALYKRAIEREHLQP